MASEWQWRALWLFNSKFIVGVTGVVVDKKQESVLLLKHRFWKGESWGLPSGYVKRGEQWTETFAREVFEESGVVVADVQILKVVSGYKLRVEALMLGELQGSPRLTLQAAEIEDARFVRFDRIDLARLRSSQRETVLEAARVLGIAL